MAKDTKIVNTRPVHIVVKDTKTVKSIPVDTVARDTKTETQDLYYRF